MQEEKETPREPEKKEGAAKAPRKDGHGENWVTHLYDKVDVSVNTLNIAAIALIVLMFVLIFAFAA